jgi:DNA end-binding protein Ku
VNLLNKKTSQAKATHAVDIFAFVEAQEIPADYFETPYILAPAPGGERVYAMLRETLQLTKKIGIAYVEIQARPQLAALLPQGEGLVLNTLRWACAENVLEVPDSPFDELEKFSGDEELLSADRMADSIRGMWDNAASEPKLNTEELHINDLQDFSAEMESETGTDMILANTLEDEEDFEDRYLASLLNQARHRPPAAGASRNRRNSMHALSQRPRMRVRS